MFPNSNRSQKFQSIFSYCYIFLGFQTHKYIHEHFCHYLKIRKCLDIFSKIRIIIKKNISTIWVEFVFTPKILTTGHYFRKMQILWKFIFSCSYVHTYFANILDFFHIKYTFQPFFANTYPPSAYNTQNRIKNTKPVIHSSLMYPFLPLICSCTSW